MGNADGEWADRAGRKVIWRIAVEETRPVRFVDRVKLDESLPSAILGEAADGAEAMAEHTLGYARGVGRVNRGQWFHGTRGARNDAKDPVLSSTSCASSSGLMSGMSTARTSRCDVDAARRAARIPASGPPLGMPSSRTGQDRSE